MYSSSSPATSTASSSIAPSASTTTTSATSSAASTLSSVILVRINLVDLSFVDADRFNEALLDESTIILVHLIVEGREGLILRRIFERSVVVLQLTALDIFHELINFPPFRDGCHCRGMKFMRLNMLVEVLFEREVLSGDKECPVDDLISLTFELTCIVHCRGKKSFKKFFVLQLNFEIVVAHLSSVHGYF